MKKLTLILALLVSSSLFADPPIIWPSPLPEPIDRVMAINAFHHNLAGVLAEQDRFDEAETYAISSYDLYITNVKKYVKDGFITEAEAQTIRDWLDVQMGKIHDLYDPLVVPTAATYKPPVSTVTFAYSSIAAGDLLIFFADSGGGTWQYGIAEESYVNAAAAFNTAQGVAWKVADLIDTNIAVLQALYDLAQPGDANGDGLENVGEELAQ